MENVIKHAICQGVAAVKPALLYTIVEDFRINLSSLRTNCTLCVPENHSSTNIGLTSCDANSILETSVL